MSLKAKEATYRGSSVPLLYRKEALFLQTSVEMDCLTINNMKGALRVSVVLFSRGREHACTPVCINPTCQESNHCRIVVRRSILPPLQPRVLGARHVQKFIDSDWEGTPL
ncbi:hypothetical protein CDAR_81871 [Caerostris darwini]|uniref:Uncharacterized protein n=1 Tax=Caerostris darwini TaxID=1538125 RepID=A0AAV4V6M8_9ARAC|nr:hypothetical protein CDAR_81871 [Caerostris darwini]